MLRWPEGAAEVNPMLVEPIPEPGKGEEVLDRPVVAAAHERIH